MSKITKITIYRSLFAVLLLTLTGVSFACDDSTPNRDLATTDTSSTEDDTSPKEDTNNTTDNFDPDNVSQIGLPLESFNYAAIEIPAHFEVESEGFAGQVPLVDWDNTPIYNPVTDAGATLGRVLFYDVNLSANRTVACSSCHKSEYGFSDNLVLSKGFEDEDTGRHSMGLTNARFYKNGKFFWDQRAATLEDQVLMPFQDPVEMGMTLETLQARVEGGDYYPELFEAAFGNSEVTTDRISLALAQFVRSMVSSTSKYDIGRAQVNARSSDFSNFTNEENFGKGLFVNPPPLGGVACFFCHEGEGFVAREATNNGLDPGSDLGYGEVTNLYSDTGTFKVPSLRNIGVRAPYMHDGRFDSLEKVIDHYSDNVQPHPNLGPPFFINAEGAVTQINLTDVEKAALVAFLHTLTDTDMLNDPKFADPFVK